LQLFLREILLANTTMGYTDAVTAVEGSQFLLEEVTEYSPIMVSAGNIQLNFL
jgi:hypothetical protein